MWLYKILYWDECWFPLPQKLIIASSIEAAWRYADIHKSDSAEHIRVCKAREYELNRR